MLAVTPSRTAGYLDAIENLTPLIEEHRASFDRDRRLPDVVFRALAEAGLFRLWLPAAMGGPDLSPAEFMQVVEAASAKDGSIGWVVANGGGMSRVAGYLPASIAREWFADPHAFIVSATGAVGSAEPVAGGYRVTGRWPFGSGTSHATRFMGLAVVSDGSNNNQTPICFYFACEQVIIHDTWHVSGLRGTGSSDFEVKNAFVPTEHTHSFLAPEPTQPGIIYRIPGLTIFPWSITGAPLGIAEGVIAAFTKSATQKRIRLGTTIQLQDREMLHRQLYQSDDLRVFDVGRFSETLIADVVGASGRENIKLACNCESIVVPASYATPLALTMNEICTNAIKHAFDDGQTGKIELNARKLGMFGEIAISDDGPDREDKHANFGFGKTLISRLAKQIGAEVVYRPLSPGTCVTLRFPTEDA
jgi:indole-3-acetate monooxygenase